MKRYADPYVAGFCLGLVVLASFVFLDRGVGVSGSFRSAAAIAAALGTSQSGGHAAALLYVMAGAFFSALIARRLKLTIERGPNITNRTRLFAAFAGGTVMAMGAYLARG